MFIGIITLSDDKNVLYANNNSIPNIIFFINLNANLIKKDHP